jgi:hypothetical protein
MRDARLPHWDGDTTCSAVMSSLWAPIPWRARVGKGEVKGASVLCLPCPNQGMEPTAYSARCAPASGSGSCPALDLADAHLH